MLTSDEQLELIDALCATAELMGSTLSPLAAKTLAQDLSIYTQPELVSALQACRWEMTGRLTAAAIKARVESADGRPEKNEAWSIALDALDEFETVVLTEEILQALPAARPILALGDRVGARMAFLSAYERLVAGARQLAEPVAWKLSVGFDTSRCGLAIERAVQLKRISVDTANAELLRLQQTPITEDGKAIAGLITGAPASPSPSVRARLQVIGDELKARHARTQKARQLRVEADRRDMAERINRQFDLIEQARKEGRL